MVSLAENVDPRGRVGARFFWRLHHQLRTIPRARPGRIDRAPFLLQPRIPASVSDELARSAQLHQRIATSRLRRFSAHRTMAPQVGISVDRAREYAARDPLRLLGGNA